MKCPVAATVVTSAGEWRLHQSRRGGEDLPGAFHTPALARPFEAALDDPVMGAFDGRAGHGIALLPEWAIPHPMRMGPDVWLEIDHGLLACRGRRPEPMQGRPHHAGIARQDLRSNPTRPRPGLRTPDVPDGLRAGVEVLAQVVLVQDLQGTSCATANPRSGSGAPTRRAPPRPGRPPVPPPTPPQRQNLGYPALDLCQQVHRRLLPSKGCPSGRASYVIFLPPKKSPPAPCHEPGERPAVAGLRYHVVALPASLSWERRRDSDSSTSEANAGAQRKEGRRGSGSRTVLRRRPPLGVSARRHVRERRERVVRA